MDVLVFSDIHGSQPVAARMAELVRHRKPGLVLLLGDILYHGPRNPIPQGYAPKLVAEALAPFAHLIVAVAGNCDSEVDAAVLPFPLARPFSWLVDGALRIFATHGHVYGPQNMPPLADGDVLLFGHTHVPMARTTPDGIRLCNPGSLALPKEGYPPTYGLFGNGVFSVLTESGETFLQLDCR